VDTIDQAPARVAEFATSSSFAITAVSRLAGRFSAGARHATRSAMHQLSPWSYSPQGFTGLQDQAAGLAEWANEAAGPCKAAMVAVPDAAGIAMELNNLTLQYALEWLEEPSRQWPHATALN